MIRYYRHVQPVTAFILAGGKSSRMGTDKAFLELAGRSLLTHAIEIASSVSQQVRIVGDREKFAAFGSVVQDLYPDHGPLGGIHAALAASDTEWNLILGVDMPFLETRFLTYLTSIAQSSAALVTVPSANGYFQPLCAVYQKQWSKVAEEGLLQGKNKIDALFSNNSLRVIDEKEFASAGLTASMFRNLNTFEDWEEAKQEFAARAQHL